MPISRRVLADDEDVLIDVRLHWVFLLGPAVLTVVAVAVAIAVAFEFPNAPVAVAGVLAAMVAVPALWLAGRVFRWLGISLVVTTARLIYRQGVLGRDLVQLRLQRVAEVQCTQTVIDRLIGSGRLVVELSGEPPMVVDDVRRPRALQRVITRQIDELDHGGRYVDADGGSSASAYGIDIVGASSLAKTPPHGVTAAPSMPGPPGQVPPAPAEGAPVVPVPTEVRDPMAPVPGDGTSIPEQLIQLDDLRRRGIITDWEFAAKKAELLSRI